MGTLALISVSEYLRSSFEPDAEYVDGVIEERAVGERDHCDVQKQLLLLLSQPSCEPYFDCIQELRVQVSASRYRVPDLCLLRTSAPREPIVLTPPLLCIEVLSPEDSMSRTLLRVRDFLQMGVPEVWIFDPESRAVQVCGESGMKEHTTGTLTVPHTSIELDVQHAFGRLP